MEPQENMLRCMANNYSTLGFWKSWHRSFNLWIVRLVLIPCLLRHRLNDALCRYIYIPLGGTKNRLLTTVLVFTFVALWHDLTFRLLAWGWLVSLFIVPEIAARYVLPSAKVSLFNQLPMVICALTILAVRESLVVSSRMRAGRSWECIDDAYCKFGGFRYRSRRDEIHGRASLWYFRGYACLDKNLPPVHELTVSNRHPVPSRCLRMPFCRCSSHV